MSRAKKLAAYLGSVIALDALNVHVRWTQPHVLSYRVAYFCDTEQRGKAATVRESGFILHEHELRDHTQQREAYPYVRPRQQPQALPASYLVRNQAYAPGARSAVRTELQSNDNLSLKCPLNLRDAMATYSFLYAIVPVKL